MRIDFFGTTKGVVFNEFSSTPHVQPPRTRAIATMPSESSGRRDFLVRFECHQTRVGTILRGPA